MMLRGSKQAVLFLKKKNQKSFSPLGTDVAADVRQMDKSFLLLFFKKEDACFLGEP
jgi:hypothetical protein